MEQVRRVENEIEGEGEPGARPPSLPPPVPSAPAVFVDHNAAHIVDDQKYDPSEPPPSYSQIFSDNNPFSNNMMNCNNENGRMSMSFSRGRVYSHHHDEQPSHSFVSQADETSFLYAKISQLQQQLQDCNYKTQHLQHRIHTLEQENLSLMQACKVTNDRLVEAHKRITKVIHCICGQELSLTQLPADEVAGTRRLFEVRPQCSLCMTLLGMDGAKFYACSNGKVRSLGRQHRNGFHMCLSCADGSKHLQLTKEEIDAMESNHLVMVNNFNHHYNANGQYGNPVNPFNEKYFW